MTATTGSFRRTDIPPVVAIIQARLDSERFPRKMLADLNGKPLLQWVIERVKRATLVHQVVVATPDQELSDLAYELGTWGYVDSGNPNNVLGRYMNAANWSNAEIVVRITGDCPLIDPIMVDNCISGYLDNRVDISTNVLRRTFPKGMDCEVLHKNTVKRIFHLTDDPRYREHVTLFAYENQPLFRFQSIIGKNDYSYMNVSVDTPKDLDRVKEMLSCIGGGITCDDVIRYLINAG